MRIVREGNVRSFIARLKKRSSLSAQEDDIQKAVKRIIYDVRTKGDQAVRRYTEKFDLIKIKKLAIGNRELRASGAKVSNDYRQALKKAIGRIRSFHERQKERTWQFSSEGVTTGQLIRAIARVGVYVPGGKAAYPSTVLMNVIPAQVAGVKEIAICVPTPDGLLNPYVAYAIQSLGVKEVYRIGGAQAVAAMAYGTSTIRRVDKIVGPGNIFVAVAKKMVYGEVGIDMMAGPSEILIIADGTANPAYIASDLLGQAEHDEMASSILITTSGALAVNVQKNLQEQMKGLSRKVIAKKSLMRYGVIIVTKSINRAVEIANRIAPEHLEIMTKIPSALLPRINNAGAIFLGQWTPEPLGDYAAGPNHTLPTGGTARFSSPLGVYDFIKRTSLINASKAGFAKLAHTVETLADVEGLTAHGNTVRIRNKTISR